MIDLPSDALGHENIRWFDIAMNDTLGVSSIERVGNVWVVPVAWYPDGTHLIAVGVGGSDSHSQSGLWKVSIIGGTPRKLIDDGRNPVVSADGSQIAFVRGAYLE